MPLTISGPGVSKLTIIDNETCDFAGGLLLITDSTNVNVSGLTINSCFAVDMFNGSANFTNMVFNGPAYSIAFWMGGGNLTISQCTFAGFEAAIADFTLGGTIDISQSTFTGGDSALLNFGGKMNVVNSTISGVGGRAIDSEEGGTLTLVNSTVANNGEGIYAIGDVVKLKNTVLSNNRNCTGDITPLDRWRLQHRYRRELPPRRDWGYE